MMERKSKRLWVPLLVMLFPALVSAEEGDWLVAPYVWLSDVTLDQSAGPGGSISASDLLDKSDTAGMIRMEAAWDHWGFTVDYVFVDASQSQTVSLPPLPPNLGVNASIDVSVVELGGFYRPSTTDSGVDYLFGVRTLNVDKTLIVTPSGGPSQRIDSSPDFTDVFAGARYLHRFDENWDLTLRGDLSFGDSEGTVNLIASAGYRFNDTFALNLGYRHLAMEFEDSSSGVAETIDLELSGPLLGFVFRF